MILKGVNLETGQEFQTVTPDIDKEFLSSMSGISISDEEIKKYIDNLNVSADVKSLLFQFSKITLKAGDFLLKIGRKIVEFVYLLYKEYKHATFGMLFGAIVGFLISSIPVLGVILGAVFTPIAVGLGLILGLSEDIQDKHLERQITEIVAKFEPLKGVAV